MPIGSVRGRVPRFVSGGALMLPLALAVGLSTAGAAAGGAGPAPDVRAAGAAVATLEDTYDAEAGNQFQAALGFIVFEEAPATSPRPPTASASTT